MIAKVGEEEERMKTKITGFSLTCKYASETRCLAEKQKKARKTPKTTGPLGRTCLLIISLLIIVY